MNCLSCGCEMEIDKVVRPASFRVAKRVKFKCTNPGCDYTEIARSDKEITQEGGILPEGAFEEDE